jgi:hypothetical protein
MYHVPFGEEGYHVKTDAENAAMKPDITVNELRELGAVTLDGVYWVSKEGGRGRYTAYSGAFVAVDEGWTA